MRPVKVEEVMMIPREVGTETIVRWGAKGDDSGGHVLNYLMLEDLKGIAISHLMKDMKQLIDRAVHDEAKERKE
jgi:hypothetical protein